MDDTKNRRCGVLHVDYFCRPLTQLLLQFRLANTTANVTYLIEESTAPDPAFKDSVETVMAQLPVLHGFTLKRTATKDDTAAFLAAFTRKIARLYEVQVVDTIAIRVQQLISSVGYLAALGHIRFTHARCRHCDSDEHAHAA